MSNELTQEQLERFRENVSLSMSFGFAPGHYFCRCNKCKSDFLGDKRSSTCFNCVEQKLNDETLKERYKLTADLGDGNRWSIVDDMETVQQVIKERIACMDDQELADLFGVNTVYMTDDEVSNLPDL